MVCILPSDKEDLINYIDKLIKSRTKLLENVGKEEAGTNYNAESILAGINELNNLREHITFMNECQLFMTPELEEKMSELVTHIETDSLMKPRKGFGLRGVSEVIEEEE